MCYFLEVLSECRQDPENTQKLLRASGETSWEGTATLLQCKLLEGTWLSGCHTGSSFPWAITWHEGTQVFTWLLPRSKPYIHQGGAEAHKDL